MSSIKFTQLRSMRRRLRATKLLMGRIESHLAKGTKTVCDVYGDSVQDNFSDKASFYKMNIEEKALHLQVVQTCYTCNQANFFLALCTFPPLMCMLESRVFFFSPFLMAWNSGSHLPHWSRANGGGHGSSFALLGPASKSPGKAGKGQY